MDRELVARAQRGDEAAFAKLIDRFGDRLYAVARRVLRSTGPSDDAVRHAPIDIWRILPRVRDPDRLISFRNVESGPDGDTKCDATWLRVGIRGR